MIPPIPARAAHTGHGASDDALRAPELDFSVDDVGVLEFAAVPTLRFALRVTSRDGRPIQSIALTAQIRIAPTQRSYEPAEQARLMELFGEPHRWGKTVHSLFWTQTTLVIPTFVGSTLVDLPVPCTYDLDVAATKYFHGVLEGSVPLELLFSGTTFYCSDGGALQTGRIPLDREATAHLPVHVWRAMMAHYFPNSAWLRLHQDVFDHLYAYRASRSLGTWEETVETLLRGAERERAR